MLKIMKSKIVISLLVVATMILTTMGTNVLGKDNNQKYTPLKYKFIDNIPNFKVNDVSYVIEKGNIHFHMNYTTSVAKNFLIAFANKNKSQSILITQNGNIDKDSHDSEFYISDSTLKGVTAINIYAVENAAKNILEGIMNGDKFSGLSLVLDKTILDTVKKAAETQSNDITDKNKKVCNIIKSKDGFNILNTGIIEQQSSKQLLIKYSSKKDGIFVISGGADQQQFVYIHDIPAGENKMFNYTIPNELIDKSTSLRLMEMDSINSSDKAYESYIDLNIPSVINDTTKYNNTSVKGKLSVTRHPLAANFSQGKLNSLPAYDDKSNNAFSVDLRSADISSLNIGNDRLNDLLHSDFDAQTKFPAKLPAGFDPASIMEIGKNPGLGINELHKKGINGKGVGIAIIDQNLLVDHIEYKDRLKCYEEMHWPSGENQSSMHGPAVASIAVGKTVGVAPGADLYYIAEQHGIYTNNKFYWDFKPLAKAIDRVLEINATLAKDKKIRVISISVGWDPSQTGYKEVTDAVKRAEKQGIFVISTSLSDTTSFNFMGLGRKPMSDPDKAESYTEGEFWKNYIGSSGSINENELLVPMDARTTASPTGTNEYVHYDNGGLSWSVPYIAGLYALACQANPKMTPEIFWENAMKTGDALIVNKNDKKYNVGKIVNPKKLIDTILQHQ